jgi:hypothetical protein
MPGAALLGRLLLARLRHGITPRLLTVGVLALAAALPVVVSAVAAVTAGQSLATALAALPAGERSVILSGTSVVGYDPVADPAALARLDQRARAGLPRVADPPARRTVVFKEVSDGHGGSMQLAGVDGLAAAVHLRSGRLPAECRPARCEVVVLDAAAGPAAPATDAVPAGLGLVVVGHARRTDSGATQA